MGTRSLMAVLALGALGLAGCSESAGPDGALEQDNTSQTVQQLSQADKDEILEILDESGFLQDDFGENDIGSAAATDAVTAAAAAEIEPTPVWARFRGRPVNAGEDGLVIELDEETGLAIATKSLQFEGEFRFDATDDRVLNPQSKPLNETLFQQAAFQHLDEEVVDDKGRTRHWKLVQVSPAQFMKTAEEQRTVRITQATFEINGEVALDLVRPEPDPDNPEPELFPLFDVENEVLSLAPDDQLNVTVSVENDNDANTPPTFVYFYHFQHKSPRGTWHRILLTETTLDDGSVVFTLEEPVTVESPPSHGKLMIDALDSQSFVPDTEDDYRANVWGVPHRQVKDDAEEPPTT